MRFTIQVEPVSFLRHRLCETTHSPANPYKIRWQSGLQLLPEFSILADKQQVQHYRFRLVLEPIRRASNEWTSWRRVGFWRDHTEGSELQHPSFDPQ